MIPCFFHTYAAEQSEMHMFILTIPVPSLQAQAAGRGAAPGRGSVPPVRR